jgi:hypothetical protein
LQAVSAAAMIPARREISLFATAYTTGTVATPASAGIERSDTWPKPSTRPQIQAMQ